MRKVSPLKAPDSRADSTEELTHVSLFSGIGGIDLAAEWAGFKTVAFVEKDKFCQKVLAKNFPGVPIHDDIKEFGSKSLAYAEGKQDRGLFESKISTNSGTGSQAGSTPNPSRKRRGEAGKDSERQEKRTAGNSPTLHLLSGGFPCQPFSVAGKRKGTGDERFLWDEMLRVIREVQPLWVLGENVRGLLSIDGGRTFGTIIHELAEVGYRVGWGVYGACHVGAPHRRERVFIVAHSRHGSSGQGRIQGPGEDCREMGERTPGNALEPGEDVPNAASVRRQRSAEWQLRREAQERRMPESLARGVWPTEPPVGRVAHGVPNRVDRLRSLGNAVVPQQVFPILNAIAEQIRGGNHG